MSYENINSLIAEFRKNVIEDGAMRHILNERFEDSFVNNTGGEHLRSVCICCDKLLLPSKRRWITLQSLLDKKVQKQLSKNASGVCQSLKDCYCFSENGREFLNVTECEALDNMFLSPRSAYIKDKKGFVCCDECRESLWKKKLPQVSIANGFWCGDAPECLTQLSEVELAFITPVKTHGYCFCFTGGLQKEIKGTLSYFKVEMESIVNTTAMFDNLGLCDNIVIVLHGKFTFEQFSRVKNKSIIRPEYILRAVKWLIENNEEWKKRGLDYEDLKEKFSKRTPTVIEDNIKIIDPAEAEEARKKKSNPHCEVDGSNIEKKETFQVFFPDGTLNSVTGGQDDMASFRDLIMKHAMTDSKNVEYTGFLKREACRDYQDNNLVNSSLLQYPYGVGGLNQDRKVKVPIDVFTDHVSKIANPSFQRELFVLVIYNMFLKQMMLTSSFCSLRSDVDIRKLSCELTEQDVNLAFLERKRGKHRNTPGHVLLKAVDSIVSSLPHTNECTRKKRKNSEALINYFHLPSFFLTVTPDDDKSFLIQVYAGEFKKVAENIDEYTEEEIHELDEKYSMLRLKYPGLAAFNFEVVLEAIIHDILGWDMSSGRMRADYKGLFGKIDGFTITMEEQGRRSVHSHIQIWASWFNNMREVCDMPEVPEKLKKKVESEICGLIDRLCCTGLFGRAPIPHIKRIHRCRGKRKLSAINVVDDQQIRNLRNKRAKIEKCDVFVYCDDCSKKWTNEEFVNAFVTSKNVSKFAGTSGQLYANKRRLKLKCVAYQAGSLDDDDFSPYCIPVAYNHHIHNRQCFKSKKNFRGSDRLRSNNEKSGKEGNNEKSQSRGNNEKSHAPTDTVLAEGAGSKHQPGDECRYRVPAKAVKQTHLERVSQNKFRWYKWDGSVYKKDLHEFAVKRHEMDAFQNMSCPEIGESRFCCNTNLQPLIPGPVSFYSTKYTIKFTQKDDIAQHKNVTTTIQGSLARSERKDSDRAEACTRTLAASFAHGSNNVVGAPMASFLTRYKTRFLYSHDFTWCPIYDIKRILTEKVVQPALAWKGKVPYFRCRALDYLCRPRQFENLTPFRFFSVTKTVKGQKGYQFMVTTDYTHPTKAANSDTYKECVELRDKPTLITITKNLFCDTGLFSSNLMDVSSLPDEVMEEYCFHALLLFTKYRNMEELMGRQPTFTARFRQAVVKNEVDEMALKFLNNHQDGHYNCIRTKVPDSLERCTEAYRVDKAFRDEDAEFDWDAHGLEEPDQTTFLSSEEILKALGVDDKSMADEEDSFPNGIPRSHDLSYIHDKGTKNIKDNDVSKLNLDVGSIQPGEPQDSIVLADDDNVESGEAPNEERNCDGLPTKDNIYSVLVTKTEKRINENIGEMVLDGCPELELSQANGSAKSIIDWAQKLKLDSRQRTAFEIFASTFVLSFYGGEEDYEASSRNRLVKEKKKLNLLARNNKKKDQQLICFLHGPGGSGKTTVVDLFVAYAKEYCEYFKPFGYVFSKNTICVTALTGVAATLLLGETVHTACHLEKKEITFDQIEAFDDTLFLVVDEISFASRTLIEKLHDRLKILKRNGTRKLFGGLHVIFAGDFRQLEPVNKGDLPLYIDRAPQFSESLTRYIELNGQHRFRNDKKWGELLQRFREGNLQAADIATINRRVVGSMDDLGRKLEIPVGVKYAVYMNRDRDAINAKLFEKYAIEKHERTRNTENMLLVYASDLEVKRMDGTYTDFCNKKKFYSECGESDIKFLGRDTNRLDPVLRLIKGGEVMLTRNMCVVAGLANGTTATVEGVLLKKNTRSVFVSLGDTGIKIRAVLANQIEKIRLRHINDRIEPRTFYVMPKSGSFDAKFATSFMSLFADTSKAKSEVVHMKGTQFPFVINYATTGHKLQGASVDNIMIHTWQYSTNWPYVVLSRVRTISGLFLRSKLRADLNQYKYDPHLKAMLREFKRLEPDYSAPLCAKLTSYDCLLDAEAADVWRDIQLAKKRKK